MQVIIRNLLVTIVLLFSISQLLAIKVSVSSLCYYQEKGYVEIYSRIMGSSVTFVSVDDSHKMGKVEMLVVIRKGERISIAEKFNINIKPLSILHRTILSFLYILDRTK